MSTPILMPKLGESVVEGSVARWLKRVGERVEKMEPLLEISTDKIDTEIPAPASGTLLAIDVAEGVTVQVGTQLGVIGELHDAEAQRRGEAQIKAESIAGLPDTEAQRQRRVTEKDELPDVVRGVGRGYLSPVVQRMAAEFSIDLAQVQGSGQGGRITKQDLLAYLERTPQPAHADAQDDAGRASADAESILHPLSAMRRAIARHMVQSVATSPHVTTIFEVDMTAVVRHREAHKAEFERRGIRLTFTPYFVVASAQALARHPTANSRYTDEGIVEALRIHVGVAVATPNGLIVPVVRDANEMNLAGVARAVQELAERARSGGLAPDEVQGGTFTLTNHGVGGSLFATPILNQPQSAILGAGAIVKRPVVLSLGEGGSSLLPGAGDAIVIRPMCYLSLSFDHRVLDGAGADAFVSSVKAALEAWESGNSTIDN